jgi:hypothetical protein
VASKEAAGGQRDRHIHAVAEKGRMAWRGLVLIVAEAAAVMPARWCALRRAPPARR